MLTFFLWYFWNCVLQVGKKTPRRDRGIFLVFFPFDGCVSISATSHFCSTAHELLLLFLHITHSPFTTLPAASLIAIFSCYLPLFLLHLNGRRTLGFPLIFFVHLGCIYFFISFPSNMLLVDTLFSFSRPFLWTLRACFRYCCFFFASWGLIFGLRVSTESSVPCASRR